MLEVSQATATHDDASSHFTAAESTRAFSAEDTEIPVLMEDPFTSKHILLKMLIPPKNILTLPSCQGYCEANAFMEDLETEI